MRDPRAEDDVSSQRRRDAAASLFAAAAHVALVVVAVRLAGDPPPDPPPHPDDGPAIIENHDLHPVDLLPLPIPPAPPEPEPRRATLPVGASLPPPRAPLPGLPPPPEPAPAPAPSATPVAPHNEYSEAPAVPLAGGPLMLGTPLWAVPGALPAGPDAPSAPGTARATGPLAPRVPAAAPGATALRDAVLSRDRELGLGNPGATAVANEVAVAVRASALPTESSAVIVARVGGDGTLLSISVQRFEGGDAGAWNGVASAAGAALGKRKIKLAGLGPGGAVVHIDVRSALTYPSGSKEKVKGILPSLTEGPPRDVMPAPSPDGDACAPERWSDLKPLCGVGMKIGTGDVTDAVSRKKRDVRASSRITLLGSPAPAPSAATPAPSTTPSAATPAPAVTATATTTATAPAPQ